MAAMEKLEPRNALLFFHASRLVSRLASRRPGILRLSLKMIVRACKLQPGASSFVAEQAYQHLLLGDFDIAAELFSEASKSEADQESENLSALCGFIRCKIMQNQFAQAQEQLEFVSTLPELSAKNPELLLLSSMVAWRKANDEARALQLLGDAIDEHRKKVVNLPPGWDLFTVYNPDFVLELATELMAHVSSEPLEAHDPPNPLLDRAAQLLAELARRVPGMIGAWLLLAKVHYVAGRLDDADRALATCVRLDGQFADVYLVQAQVSVARKSYAQAAQALEQALGLSFEVRNTPLYHFIRGRVLNQTGKPQEALKLLEAGMALPGVKRASQSHIVSVQDRISLFLELARTHAALNHLPEAAKVMNDARFEFEKCQEFARVQIAEADLALMRRDVDSAVNTLRSVPSHNPYFTRAKIRLADVYLKLRRNKRMYLGCFEDLASHSPSAHMHVLLGEAALRAQEPERAIRAFEEALALDKDNAVVRSLIGRALVATHDYARAVNYYESALAADRTKVILAHELAELYLQLKQFPKATQVLATTAGVLEAKRSESGGEDAVALRELVTTRTLLARVSEASNGSASEAENHLKEALKVQIELLSALRARDADALQKERAVAADLCYKLARLFQSRLLDNGKALQFYNEALQHHDTHLESMFALARLHLAMGDLDAYQSVCRSMRAAFPDHLEVSMMLADVMFRKGEYDAATFHFKQLLEKNPCHYEALARLVMLLRRAGNLGDALRFFTLAERASTKAQYDAGFNYCKGLFHRFSNQPREALKHFNQARKDGVWAREALYHMVEIYLLPDNASLFQESTEAKGNANEHVSAAENLLKELRQWGETENSKRYSLLMCYAAMMTRLKERVEFALTTAADILSNDRDNPAALLAMANAFALQKQETKARNQLKRIAKLNFDPSYAEEFERGWLMLADVYVQLGKFDLAQELCKKALANNRSCAKAWELMGVMMEKEQSYQDAADKYERAWKLLNESSSAVGYKLAFNYLKARRLVEAISVCHKVLDAFPDYPRIRKDILDKAREGLRP
jgi:tetratricopeptide repeat protein 21B